MFIQTVNALTKIPLLVQLLAACVLGVIVGVVAGAHVGPLFPLCLLFVKLLKILAMPLLFTAIVDAVATTRMRAAMAGAMLAVSLGNAAVAIVIALGIGHTLPVARMVNLEAMRRLGAMPPAAVAPTFTRIDHALNYFTIGNLLYVIAAAILIGIGLRVMQHLRVAARLVAIDKYLLALCMRIIGWLIMLVPLSAFGIVASVVGRGGAQLFVVLGAFVLLVALGMFLQMFVYYGLLVRFVARRPLGLFFRRAATAFATSMSTGSSLATLPVTLKTLEEDMHIAPEAARLAACVGTNFNHDGIILYEASAALFIAHVFGILLTTGAQLKMIATSVIAAVGIAGVPEAGLITLSLVLGAAGLPLSAVPLLLPVDWLLGRFRATVNVASDITVANIIDERVQKLM